MDVGPTQEQIDQVASIIQAGRPVRFPLHQGFLVVGPSQGSLCISIEMEEGVHDPSLRVLNASMPLDMSVLLQLAVSMTISYLQDSQARRRSMN